MALPVNIDDLVNHRKVEWARIEYKEGWNPEKVLHSLCAFANDIDNWGGGLVEGRNTGVPVIVNVMRRNGSPMPVFSSPENRDWLSVTLPVNPHFCEMKSPISQTTALKTALKNGETALKTAQKTALKTALKTGEIAPERPKIAPEIALEIAPKRFRVQKSKKIRERMAQIIQCLLRNRRTSIADLVAAMNVSLRTLRADISLLRKIKVLKRIGADKNGSWDVLLDYGRNR